MKRGSGLSRSTPLVARTALTTRTELARTSGLTRTAPLPRQAPEARGAKDKPRHSGGGDPIPRDLAAYILERADGCCDWCGRYCLDGYYSRQHRLARGMGGRAGAHTAANLVLVCGSATSPGGCHLRCERTDIPAARHAGFRLRDGQDPELVPILRHGRHLVYPTAQGWVTAT